MFGNQHAGRKIGGVVVWQYRDAGLTQNRSFVQTGGDKMNAGPGLNIARGNSPRMGIQARIFRQQGRVDIKDTPGVASDELWRQNTYETGKRDDIGAGRIQMPGKLAFKRLTILAKRAVIDAKTCDAKLPGPSETARLAIIAAHQHRTGRMGAGHRLDQLHHVRATARDQDRDPFHARSPRYSTPDPGATTPSAKTVSPC